MRCFHALLLLLMFFFGSLTVQSFRFINPNASNEPSSETTPSVEYMGRGVTIGIQATSGGPFWRTYGIPSATAFAGRVSLSNQQSPTNYLLTCLLDYRQESCIWDGTPELLYTAELDENEERIIPFTTPTLSTGFHDFAVLAISNAGAEDLGERYRISTDLSYLYASRAVLLSGDEPWQPPALDEVFLGGERNSSASLEGVIVNQEEYPVELRAWTVYEAIPGETIDYYIHVGNGTDDNPPNTFAILAFLDYRQIPIDGENQWVAFAEMPPGSATTLPAQMIAPEEPGIHELMIVFAYNPYTMLEEPPFGEDRHLTRTPHYVFSSIRTAIVVEESNSP